MILVPIIIFWYIILMLGLGKFCPITIGIDYTEEFILYVCFYEPIEPRWCEMLCLETIIILDYISDFLGHPLVLNIPELKINY